MSEVPLPESEQLPDAPWRRGFRRRLKTWYADHARDLPWRRSRDPYAVWVSEIMLQQTQVATVRGYFDRFIRAFPTIDALARADEQDVLRLWEGLGYYRRARQLHAAAKIVADEHGGRFPRNRDAVDRLPGIGRYTAGAILSIAFDQRQPILEANTVRLFCRLLGYEGDPASTAGQRLLWAMAEAVLPRREVGLFNQALMELGSEVCVGRAPPCDGCPIATLCPTRQQGKQTVIPRPKPKKQFEAVREAAVVVRRGNRVLLLRCPEGGRWAGLWDFPRFAVETEQPEARRRELIDKVRQATGVLIEPGEHLKTIKHGVTRFRITLDCYEAAYCKMVDGRAPAGGRKWLLADELEEYPLSSTGRRICRLA